MNKTRLVYAGAVVLASVVALGAWKPFGQAKAHGASSKIPKYVVDPYWPKPIPQRWVTGEVAGTCIDSRDHIFTVNRRNLDALETSFGWPIAPPVVEYDGEGNVVNGWGDPAIMPNGLHGCHVDYQDNVWVAGNGDGIVQKYTHEGKLLMQIGVRGKCDSPTGACGVPDSNSSTTSFSSDTYSYNNIAETLSETNKLSQSGGVTLAETYAYTPIRLVSQRTNYDGRVHQYFYDNMDRMVRYCYPSLSSGVEGENFTYDPITGIRST